MKKKILAVLLVLVTVLVLAAPAPALAAKPTAINSVGTITYISPGDVSGAGASGRYVVAERVVTGTLYGDISGAYTFAYKANVKSLDTQAGAVHGKLTVGDVTLNVNGESHDMHIVDYIDVGPPFGLVPVFQLTVSGHWTVNNGGQGTGDFEAVMTFVATLDGHVAFVIPAYSGISLTGQGQP